MWITLIIFLFVAAFMLVLAEFVVPGAVLGILGGILFVASCVVAYIKTDYGLWITVAEIGGMIVCVLTGMYLIGNTRFGNIMVLDDQQDASKGWVAPSEDPNLVGSIGAVYSALRPAGAIVVNGRRIDAVSDGTFIEKGESIRVIEVEGNRVVVERSATV